MGAATGAIIGGALGAAQMIGGAIGKKKAKKAIDNYSRQQLTNAYEHLGVSTRGADLQREEMQRNSAMAMDALRAGGARALIGGIGRIGQYNATSSRQIGADLDMQQNRIDQMRAQDDIRIQQMMEQREREDLAGLGREFDYQRDQFNQGFGAVAQGAVSAANLWGLDRKAVFGGQEGNKQNRFIFHMNMPFNQSRGTNGNDFSLDTQLDSGDKVAYNNYFKG